MRFLRTFAALLISITALGQQQYIDSLKSIVEIIPNDTTKVIALNDLSSKINRIHPDDALIYGEQARMLAQRLDYKIGYGNALKNIGTSYNIKRNYIKVLEYWERSLAVFRSINYLPGEASLLSNLGTVYYSQGDLNKAERYYNESLAIAEEIGDYSQMARIMMNIGGIYYDDKPLAIDYFRRAVNISAILEDEVIYGYCLLNLGKILLEDNKPEIALTNLTMALDAFEASDSELDIIETQGLIGLIHTEKGDYTAATQDLEQALAIAYEIESYENIAILFNRLGNIYLEKDEIETALNYYRNSVKISTDKGMDYPLKDAYEGIYRSYKSANDVTNALAFLEKYMYYKDTVSSLEAKNEISGLQFLHDQDLREMALQQQLQRSEVERQKAVTVATAIIISMLLLLLAGMLHRFRYISKAKSMIEIEKSRSDNLLKNILPNDIAEELKVKGKSEARHYDSVTILFTDFVNFSEITRYISPSVLIEELNEFYNEFDNIISKYRLEKIKTIGDSYMAVGGLPTSTTDHAKDVVYAAFEIEEYVARSNERRRGAGKLPFCIRIGIHTGPVVAGIVGKKKFQYDIYGDTVNIASRVESKSLPGKINISEATYQLVKNHFNCAYRGEIDIKNRGKLKMYFAVTIKSKLKKLENKQGMEAVA